MAKKKKKQKLNIPFLVTIVLTSGGVVGLAGFLILRQGRAAGAETARDKALELYNAGQIQEAYDELSRVAHRLNTDSEAMMLYYRAGMYLTSFDNEKYRLANAALFRVISQSPQFLPALNEQLKIQKSGIERGDVRQASLDELDRSALAILAIDPKHIEAIEARALVTVSRMRQTLTQQTSATFAAAAEELEKTAADHPQSVELPFQAINARLGQAERSRAEQPTVELPQDIVDTLSAALASIDQQLARVDDASISSNDRNEINLRSINSLRFIAAFYQRDQEKQKEISDRIEVAIRKSVEIAKPEDENFELVLSNAGGLLQTIRRLDESEAAFKKMKEGRPQSWMGRLLLADHYRRTGRLDDAIRELEVDLQPSIDLYGLDGVMFRQVFNVEAMIQRAFLRLMKIQSIPAAERAPLRALIETDLQRASAERGEQNAALLRIRAGLAEIDGNLTGATQMLSRAIDLVPSDASQGRDEELRNELRLQMAQISLRMNQTGKARELLESVARETNNPGARLMLAEILLRDRLIPEARTQLQEILKVDPNNNNAKLLIVPTLETPEERKAALDALPEGDAKQITEKFRVAASIRQLDEAVRLGEAALVQSPGDKTVSLLLAELYSGTDRGTDARRILDNAIVKQPGDEQLKFARQRLDVTTQEQATQLAQQQVASIEDPFLRKVAESQLAAQAGDDARAEALLVEADALDTNRTGAAAERLFVQFALTNQFDKARTWLERLKQLNTDQAGGRIYEGRLLLAQGRSEEALALARTLIAELPGYAQPHLLMGLVQQATGRFSESLNSFNEALKLQPRNVEALRGAVSMYERLGRQAEAKPLVDRGISIDPNDAFFVDKRLNLELYAGNAESVIEPRSKLVEMFPGNPLNRLRLAEALEVSAVRRANAGNNDGAAELWRAAQQVYGNAMRDFPGSIEFVDGYARMSAATGDFAAGRRMYEASQARESFTTNPQFALRFANFLTLGGENSDAETLLRDFLAKTDSDEVRVRLVQMLMADRRGDEALKVLEGRTDKASTNLRIDLLLGAGRFDEARAEAERQLAENRSPATLMVAALVDGRSGDPARIDRAQGYLDEALRADASNMQARFMRARVLTSKKPVPIDDIIADLEAVRSAEPGNAEARLLLADMYNRSGRRDDYLRELETASLENPADKRLTTAAVDALSAQNPPRHADMRRILDRAIQQPALANDPDLWLTRAKLLAATGEADAAIDAARNGRKFANDSRSSRAFFFELLNVLGRYQDVIKDSEPLLASAEPADLYLRVARGIAEANLKNRENAAREFEQAYAMAAETGNESSVSLVANAIAVHLGADEALKRIEPRAATDRRWKLFAAELHRNKRDFPQAMTLFEQVIADPAATPNELASAYRSLGTLCLMIDPPQNRRAVELFTKLIEIVPTDLMALNNLAYALTLPGGGGTPEQALAISQQAYELMQRQGAADAYILDTHGWNLVQAGRVEEGIVILQNALGIQKLPESHYHLGEAYLRVNRPQDAADQFKNSLDLIETLRQNQQTFDADLPRRVNDALSRAQAAGATP